MLLNELTVLPPQKTTEVPKAVGLAYVPSSLDIQRVISWYQDGGFHEINAVLRNHPAKFTLTSDEMMQDHGFVMTADEAIPILDTAMEESPRRSRTIRTYRGEGDAQHLSSLSEMEIGQHYRDPGFVSSSFDPSYAYYAFGADTNTISMYIIPTNVSGLRLPTQGDDPEKEFLLGRDCTFTLVEKSQLPIKNHSYRHKSTTLLTWRVSA